MIIPVSINVSASTFTALTRFPFANGQEMVVDSRIPGNVPAPLADYDTSGSRVSYYVVNLTGSTFQLSATSGGAAITLSSAGTGQITVSEFPPLTWEALKALPLLQASDVRNRFTRPESLINLSSAPDTFVGVSVSGNVFTSGIPHNLTDWTAVQFSSTLTLPSPLAANTTYYARDITSDSAFSVASVIGGSAITLTSTGTGQVSFQNYSLTEVLENKIELAGQWLYDYVLLAVSKHMKFVSRSWWWWFTPPTSPTESIFYPAINRSQIVLDCLKNPEKLLDAWIDFTAWAMIQDGSWANLVKDSTFFQQFGSEGAPGDTAQDRAERRAKKRADSLMPLLIVSGYQGARKIFDFDQTSDTLNISLV